MRRRVSALERGAGVPGGTWCECGRVRVSFQSDGWPYGEARKDAPQVCKRCGKPVPAVEVRFDEVADWRDAV